MMPWMRRNSPRKRPEWPSIKWSRCPEARASLGNVSVRFRDTASGGMVERGWTIPYDRNAPAIDRATPSMQLAALAMFAGEKLKGGPLGEAVDFETFTESRRT